MHILSLPALLMMSLTLSGCVAGKIVTAPIRAAGTVVETAVDATTQTQSEREEDIGRKVLAQYEDCLDRADNAEERQQCRDRYGIDD